MNPWTGHRQVKISVNLLDYKDQVKARLDGVTGGSVEFTQNTRLRGSGQLELLDRGQDIDFLKDRVQIKYELYSGESIPLGVWLLSAPTMSTDGQVRKWKVDLLSKLAILDEDCVESAYSVAAGTPIIETVKQLIESTGETRLAVTEPSGGALLASGNMVWEAGTPKLTVINALLESINYWSLWVDGGGQFRVEPYVRPVARPIRWSFEKGSASIHVPSWQRDQDTAGVPNKIILVSQSEDANAPSLTATALNENPASPFCFQARGRWITHVETGVEASSQKVLDELAQRRLIDRSSPVANIMLQHLPVPIDPGDAVQFARDETSVRAVVQKWSMNLEPTALAKTTVREVVDL